MRLHVAKDATGTRVQNSLVPALPDEESGGGDDDEGEHEGDVPPGGAKTSGVCMALVLEMCDRGGLDEVLCRTACLGKWSSNGLSFAPHMRAVLLCLIELALALKYLHAHNIAHCDVKPGNVMAK